MKSDMSRRYHTRVVTNILYSAVISCLVEIFLVTNVSMIARYMEESGRMNRLLQAVLDYHVAVVLVYVVSGLVLFAVTFMILQEPYIRYISNISDAVQSISEGNLNTTIDVIGDDEFSSMAANLNKMVEDIRELMDKERESERTKNELITNVAHDLRTPLTSIIGYLELLAGNSKIPAQMQHKYIEIAYGKARRLEKLIEDLFGFTKLNYGRISMHVSQLDVVKLLGQLLEEAYPNFVEKNLSYDLQSNVPVKIITADGNLLARLFDNLIGNASSMARRKKSPGKDTGPGGCGDGLHYKLRLCHTAGGAASDIQQVLPGGTVPFQQYGGHGPGTCHCKGNSGHAWGNHQCDQRFGRHRVHGKASGEF